jgi:hypothetical protein
LIGPSATHLCTGRVIREDATPVAGALAAVTRGTAPTPEIAIRADENGSFRVALPNGRFHIEASGPGMATGSIELVIEDRACDFEIVLKHR